MAAAEEAGNESCPICRDALQSGGGEPTHTLECHHTFHTECVMAWFRQGNDSCPNCRDVGAPLPRMTANYAFAYLRREAMRRDAPPLLKLMSANYGRLAKKHDDIKRQLADMNKSKVEEGSTVASVLSASTKLRRKVQMCKLKTWRARLTILDLFRVTRVVLPVRRCRQLLR